MSEITTVGLELAKGVLQEHGAVGSAQEAEAGSDPGILRSVVALRHCDGSLRLCALPGPRDRQTGP